MIDTIRFKIPINKKIYNELITESIELSKYDHKKRAELLHITTKEVQLPSYNRKINIIVVHTDFCFLELSLPKFLYGHNLFLLYRDKIQQSLIDLKVLLQTNFPSFPDISRWIIQRIDLCYSWKYKEESEADLILQFLQTFEFPRKKKCSYDTSVMYIGSNYSIKFYLKSDEYFKHDFKELQKNGFLEYSYEMLNVSRGILRFEITLRKRWLNKYFKKDITFFDLPDNFCLEKLQYFFNKYMSGFNIQYLTKKQVLDNLNKYYDKKKARRLYLFHCFITNFNKKDLKSLYANSTIYQYLRELKVANIPLTFDKLKQIDNFDLKIPSENVVNPPQGG